MSSVKGLGNGAEIGAEDPEVIPLRAIVDTAVCAIGAGKAVSAR
jgi:hypothetical protein